MAEIDDRREQLQARLGEMLHRLERLKSDAAQGHSSDSAEQAQERENDEVVDAIGVETRESLAQLQAALERIEAGTYGVCENCGEAIAGARLEARPEATHCISCAD